MVLANMGIPMISVLFPAMWGAFIPVVVIETMILKRRRQLKLRPTLCAVFCANIVSTLVGIPLSWILYFLVTIPLSFFLHWVTGYPDYHTGGQTIPQLIAEPIMYAGWIGPGQSDPVWLMPAALMCLLFTAFMMTVVIETPIIGYILERFKVACPRKPWQDVIVANAYSYVTLEIVMAVLTISGLLFVYG